MRDERGKMKEERVTDYIRRDLEDLTVKDLLEILRSQPDGAGDVSPYDFGEKKLEMLKKELDRYLTVPTPVKMPDGERGARGSEPLYPGDTVRLRSGGPLMTVLEEREGVVRCAWFQGKENREGSFPAVALYYESPAWEK